MDLQRYVRALRKSWWLVVACTVLGAVAGYAYSARQTPVYASHLTFYVASPALNSADANATNQFAQDRANSYAGLVGSDALAKRVLSVTGIKLSEKQLAREISGSAQLNTVLIEVTIRDTSRQRALAIGTAVGNEFPKLVSDLDNSGAVSGAANAAVNLTVVSGPTASLAPVSPRTKLDVGAGFVLGLLVGLGIAVLRELLDVSVGSAEALAEVSGVPVLGTISFDPGLKEHPLVVGDTAYSPRAEALRQLRTNLRFVDAAKPLRTIVITSSREAEGKSTTSVNLALVVAEAGRRVLLIDADLRNPRVGGLLSLESAVGLSNVLVGQLETRDVIQRWGDSNVSVLPSGPVPPNPSELLDGDRMATLLDECAAEFDLVILDSPPLRPVTDAALIAAKADGAVIVFRCGRTKRVDLVASIASLKSVHARVLGCVLNMRPLTRVDKRGYAAYAPSLARSPSPETAAADPSADDTVADDPSADDTVAAEVEAPPDGPDVTIPDVTIPDVTIPDVTIPDVTIPDVTIPDEGIPEDLAPVETEAEADADVAPADADDDTADDEQGPEFGDHGWAGVNGWGDQWLPAPTLPAPTNGRRSVFDLSAADSPEAAPDEEPAGWTDDAAQPERRRPRPYPTVEQRT